MIEATKAFKTSDGMTFPTLEQAQEHSVSILVGSAEATKAILENKDAIIAILKLKPRKTKTAKPAKAAKKPAAKPAANPLA